MPISEDEFRSWCYRNGGETYEESTAPGIVCQFPDVETPDRVAFLPDVDAFQVIAQGVFYQTRSLHQNAESQIDDDDRLHINTDDVRLVVDPS